MLSGLGAISMTEESIRGAVTDMRLPKEAVGYLLDQADSTRDQFLALVARELRDYLEDADLGAEMAKALSSLRVEISTTIQFQPEDEAAEAGEVTPKVSSKVGIKRTRKKR